MALREIAQTVGNGLKIPAVSVAPENAAEHFGVDAQDVRMGTDRAGVNWRPGQHEVFLKGHCSDHCTGSEARLTSWVGEEVCLG